MVVLVVMPALRIALLLTLTSWTHALIVGPLPRRTNVASYRPAMRFEKSYCNLEMSALYSSIKSTHGNDDISEAGDEWRGYRDSDEEDDDGEIPSMDWLTKSLEKENPEPSDLPQEQDEINAIDFKMSKMVSSKTPSSSSSPQYYMEEHNVDDNDLGDVPIPTTGVSVADEMEATQKDRFTTRLVPIKMGLQDRGIHAAQILTTATFGSFEPVRYIIRLDKQQPQQHQHSEGTSSESETHGASTSSSSLPSTFVLIDVPPFSETLASNIRSFMGPNGRLAAILVTNRDAIHYDDAPSVYTTRRADLEQWNASFPDMEVVAYRLDIPRDCRESVTQVLDGYGPFANEEEDGNDDKLTFVETGRPLTYQEWDHDVTQDIMTRGHSPPDDDDEQMEYSGRGGGNQDSSSSQDDPYSPKAIRKREEGKRILAIYTPGHSFGSVTYIFPETGLCCSGLLIPVEDNRSEDNPGMSTTGPALDCRGYITTSKAGITRQMESARQLINSYHDRFSTILPSRGDPLLLGGKALERKHALLNIIDDYDKIGQIYEQLGITSFDEDA